MNKSVWNVKRAWEWYNRFQTGREDFKNDAHTSTTDERVEKEEKNLWTLAES